MGGFSLWHILILAILVLLLFGGNRFSSMMGDIAKGMKSFKQGLADDEDDGRRRAPPPHAPTQIGQAPGQVPPPHAPQAPIDITPTQPPANGENRGGPQG